MAKNKNQSANQKQRVSTTPGAKPASSTASMSHASFVLGVVFMLIAVGASLMLVLKRVARMKVPGCSDGGACDQASNAMVPFIQMPVASMGLAFFLLILTGWLASMRVPSTAFRWLVRLGVLGSIGFLAAMVVGKHYCPYCLAAHAGNLAFWM